MKDRKTKSLRAIALSIFNFSIWGRSPEKKSLRTSSSKDKDNAALLSISAKERTDLQNQSRGQLLYLGDSDDSFLI